MAAATLAQGKLQTHLEDISAGEICGFELPKKVFEASEPLGVEADANAMCPKHNNPRGRSHVRGAELDSFKLVDAEQKPSKPLYAASKLILLRFLLCEQLPHGAAVGSSDTTAPSTEPRNEHNLGLWVDQSIGPLANHHLQAYVCMSGASEAMLLRWPHVRAGGMQSVVDHRRRPEDPC